MTTKRKAKRKKLIRVHYGFHPETGDPLYWDNVKAIPATEPVILNSTVLDALKGTCGDPMACHLANTAMREKALFPHPALLAVLIKSRAYIVSKIKGGKPSEVYVYQHKHNDLVDLNDDDINKEFVQAYPEIAECKIAFYPPPIHKARPNTTKNARPRGKPTGERRRLVQRGALQRAIRAKLISPGILLGAK